MSRFLPCFELGSPLIMVNIFVSTEYVLSDIRSNNVADVKALDVMTAFDMLMNMRLNLSPEQSSDKSEKQKKMYPLSSLIHLAWGTPF